MIAGFGLGANLGDREATLKWARERLLQDLQGDLDTVRYASLWETEPLDCPEGSEVFLNTVVELSIPESDPHELLQRTQAIEAEAGRIRSGVRNAPRPLDIDILYLDDLVIDTETLLLPHPRLAERLFVLAPLTEIRKDWMIPGQNTSVQDSLARVRAQHEQTEPKRLRHAW